MKKYFLFHLLSILIFSFITLAIYLIPNQNVYANQECTFTYGEPYTYDVGTYSSCPTGSCGTQWCKTGTVTCMELGTGGHNQFGLCSTYTDCSFGGGTFDTVGGGGCDRSACTAPTGEPPSCSVGGGGGGGITPPPTSTPDFSISVSVPAQSALNGESRTYDLKVTPNNSAAVGPYTFIYPIPGCPVGASCEYIGGNTASTGTDTTWEGTEILTSTYKQVRITIISARAGTYPLTFSATKDGTSTTNSTGGALIVNPGVNNSSCTSITAPSSVVVGSTFNVTAVMYNNGSTVWSPNDMRADVAGVNNYHILVSPWNGGTGIWGASRTGVTSPDIAPGGSETFTIPVTAPSTPGTYNYSTQMIQEGIQWFGAICSASPSVTVTAAVPPAVTINPSATSVTSVTVGQAVIFTVSATSGSGLNELGLESTNSAGTPISNLGASAASGNSATRTFSWPSTAVGTYYFDGYAWNTTRTLLTRTTPPTTVTVNPVVNIAITSFNPYRASITDYPTTNNNTVYWTTTGSPTSCVATGSSPWGSGPGTTAVNASIASGSHYQGVYPSVGTYTYTLRCSKAGVSDAIASFFVPVSSSYTLTIEKTIGGSVNITDGLISCGSTCTGSYKQGTSVTLQPLPDTIQWIFVGWGEACSGQGTGNCTLIIGGNTKVKAQFRPRILHYQEF